MDVNVVVNHILIMSETLLQNKTAAKAMAVQKFSPLTEGLQEYTQVNWDTPQVVHLLKRNLFGAKPDITFSKAQQWLQAVK